VCVVPAQASGRGSWCGLSVIKAEPLIIHTGDYGPYIRPASAYKITRTSMLARANSATRLDKVILIYDSLFILLKSFTLNLHVDIGASILKLVSVHPNFVAWVVLDWWMEIQ
jgi:hypothetical protein